MSAKATCLLMLLCLVLAPQGPARSDGGQFEGRPLSEVLDELRGQGLPLVYSTNLVDPGLVVSEEPAGNDPADLARQVLAPHGLALEESAGSLVVVRATETPPATVVTADPAGQPGPGSEGPVELEDLSISASRYILFSNSQFFIDQRAIQALPDLGEDPLRAAQRLPGAAAGGLSSRSHFRGGENNETAIYLNGLELVDPFHIRDYHSIFSTIDARAISGMEAYTGGFPAMYGDSMSGVLLFESVKPDRPLRTELGLSIHNTSLLNSGFTEDGRLDWLVSARSSNLDLVLDESIGEPDYFDVFAELGIQLATGHRLSVNALYSDDKVTVITESDPEELEQSVSDTGNSHMWVLLENDWTTFLSSRTVLSWSEMSNRREAEANDPERMVALASDRRNVETAGLKQDWTWAAAAAHTLRWGFTLRRETADFDYRAEASYHGFYELYPGIDNPVRRLVSARPSGSSYALYLSDRWRLSQASSVELGLRWDRQTYTGRQYGNQLSPRLSFLHSTGTATELRLTWGRYYQSQAIQDLQVEDGLDDYFAPQRTDHWIAGIQHRFEHGYRLRAEAFYKDYDRLRPRFENLFDPLALIPELAPDRVRVEPQSARALGLETTIEYRGDGETEWWATYTWSKAEDRIDGRMQPRSWDQRHALQAGLAWQRGPWEVGVALSVHSGWPTTGMEFEVVTPEDAGEEENEAEAIPVPGPRNGEQLGTYAQIDFRVSREFEVRYGSLSAFFEVTNASNRNNPCCIDYDVEEEDGELELDRAVEHWLPIIPAIGILWEF
jgi:outer membrane receptor protein involved in Fe transport